MKQDWLKQYPNGGELNYNNSSVQLPKDFVGDGYYSPIWKSPAWGGRFQDGGEVEYIINNKKISNNKGEKIDSLSNRLRELQYEQTKQLKTKFPKIPINSILSTEANDKKFRNSNLNQKSDSLTSLYGDVSVPVSDDYFNTAKEYGNLINIAGQTQDVVGNKEKGLRNFGYRSMLYKYLHPDTIPAYKMLEEDMHIMPDGTVMKNSDMKNGGELKKLDDLTNFGQIIKNKWLSNYK